MGQRIAYLVNQYPSNSHAFIRREIQALERLGVPVQRITIRRVSDLADPADVEEAERTRCLVPRGKKPALGLFAAMLRRAAVAPGRFLAALRLAWRIGRRSDRGLLRHGAYLAEACQLAAWAKADGITHVHAHFGTNSTTVAMLCDAVGGPSYSFTVHGPEEFDRPEALGLPEKIARARFVVAISDYGRSQLLRWSAADQWHKVHIVRCGVDDAFLRGAGVSVGDSRRLVCVARLHEQKGHLALIEALRVVHERGQAFEMLLIGDGPLRKEIEQAIATAGLQEVVRIGGWMAGAAIREALQASRVLVLPSFAEGLPVVIMEALALRRPVVSTYIAGIPELVAPGRNGYLVPAGNVPALVEALERVLTAPAAELDAMGAQGAAAVARQHDASREAQKLAGLFGYAGSVAEGDGSRVRAAGRESGWPSQGAWADGEVRGAAAVGPVKRG